MDINFGPNSVDEPSLLYKLQRKIKVFNTNNPLPNRGYNLVTCTSKYGIVFIASPTETLSVYYLKDLIDKECEAQNLSVKLQVSPTHISVNCNQEWLAVYGGQMLLVYKCMDFNNPDIRPSVSIKCDVHPSTFVSALQWNPCIPDTIGIVFFDGTILVSQVSTMQVKKIQSNARCLCWSPKGKQLVTGNNDGTLTQYKPDLSQMKMVPAPNLFEGAPVEALTIYWISTYQFAVAYRNASDNSRPAVTIVNTPKGGSPSFCNYEDICYSMGCQRPWYYYLQGLAQWNLIITSSSNSMEMATLSTADGSNWVQWCQPDEARPELPLTEKKRENYPVGLCIDTAAIHQLPWGENVTLPPMPLLHVVSHTGWLSIFNIINLNKAASQICNPAQPLVLPAAAMTRNIPDDVPAPPQEAPPQPKPQPQAPQMQPSIQPSIQPQTIQPPQPVQTIQPQIQPAVVEPKPVSQAQGGVVQSTPTLPPPYTAKKVPTVAEIPTSVPQTKQPIQVPKPPSTEASAAMKLEQERINIAKANQELKNMLIKEVNDFQMELYNFVKLTQERKQKFQQEIQSANFNVQIDMDTEKLKKECSIEDLRETIIQLKLELVRSCAVVAEAKAHSEVKDHQEWTQTDPLTAKRVANVKKLAYYVQNQMDQARKALDHKWDEMMNRDQYAKSKDRMIRPILDDVYQPLVKQQKILSRQQATLKSLRNTMNELNFTPIFRSTSLLRSTPFRNKDPLSKLTKNILNMSIEPQNKSKNQNLSNHKLDALRDVLSNHKPIKIKPASVELTQHLENMKKKYEQSVKEREIKEAKKVDKVEAKQEVQTEIMSKDIKESIAKTQTPAFAQMPVNSEAKQITPSFNPPLLQPSLPVKMKTESIFSQAPPMFNYNQPSKPIETKPDIVKESPMGPPSSFKPTTPLPVVRTLFTDEAKENKPQEPVAKPVQSIQQTGDANLASQTTKSLLRQYILKDSHENKSNENKDGNFFLGQSICSPTFGVSKPQTNTTPSVFSKPKPEASNVFKIKPESSEPSVNPNDETGEPENAPQKDKNKEEKITNMFTLKTNTLANKNQNIPDVLQSQGFVFGKPEAKAKEDKSKENVPEKSEKASVGTKEDLKPSLAPMAGKAPAQSVITVDLKKPVAEAKIEKIPSSVFTSMPVSPPPIVSKEQGFFAIAKPNDATSQDLMKSENAKPKTIPPTKPALEENTTSVTITIPKPKETKEAPKETTDVTETKDTKTETQNEVASTTAATIVNTSETKPIVFSTPTPTSNASAFSPNTSVLAQTTQGSIFATQTTQSSLFGTQTTSVFQTSPAQSLFSAAASKSLFGATTTTQSLFGSTATSQSSAFGSTSVFGSQSPNQGFGSSQVSIFGATTQASPVFDNQGQTTQASVFGSPTQTQASVFGSPTQTTQTSVFGTTTQTTQASVFGTPNQTTQASVFGTPTQTTQASIFGTPTQTTQASVFGTPTQTAQASIFGTPTQTTQASIFGTPSQAAQTSVFGTPAQTTQASIFGTPTQSTQASVFGTPTQTTQASIFGTPTQTTQASIFGSPTTQASVFGTPATTQSGLFGNNESDLFASASISTTSASQTGGSIFGSSSGSVFGNSNVFGSKTSFAGSNPAAANIFGGSTTFGQKPATDFWSGANANAGGFGSSGFGQQATTQASSIFGSSGGSFSTPSAQPFGSQSFSGDNKPSVFGTPQQQTGSAFGGSAVFGSKPTFGGSPGFGAPAFGGFNKSPSSGFGAPASFGGGFGTNSFGNTSPGNMFGNASPGGGFGSPTQSNATFESLATQNTLTFGNLAQQSGSPQPAAPSFNTSPSFTGWRG